MRQLWREFNGVLDRGVEKWPEGKRVFHMRHRSTLGLTVALLFAVPASAQVFDMSTMKCSDFLQSVKTNGSYIVMWWQGYYARKSGADPVINFSKFIKNAESLGNYCRENPSVELIAAAEKVIGE
jgi:acid stress chaperone HdeB